MLLQTIQQSRFSFLHFSFQDEGPETRHLLAGDGQMGRLWGELGPSVWSLGVLTHLLPHFQEPHPAAAHYEHWLVESGEGGAEKKQLVQHESIFTRFPTRGDDFWLWREDHGQSRWEDGGRHGQKERDPT